MYCRRARQLATKVAAAAVRCAGVIISTLVYVGCCAIVPVGRVVVPPTIALMPVLRVVVSLTIALEPAVPTKGRWAMCRVVSPQGRPGVSRTDGLRVEETAVRGVSEHLLGGCGLGTWALGVTRVVGVRPPRYGMVGRWYVAGLLMVLVERAGIVGVSIGVCTRGGGGLCGGRGVRGRGGLA